MHWLRNILTCIFCSVVWVIIMDAIVRGIVRFGQGDLYAFLLFVYNICLWSIFSDMCTIIDWFINNFCIYVWLFAWYWMIHLPIVLVPLGFDFYISMGLDFLYCLIFFSLQSVNKIHCSHQCILFRQSLMWLYI